MGDTTSTSDEQKNIETLIEDNTRLLAELRQARAERDEARAMLKRAAPFFNGVYQKDNPEAVIASLALMREIDAALRGKDDR